MKVLLQTTQSVLASEPETDFCGWSQTATVAGAEFLICAPVFLARAYIARTKLLISPPLAHLSSFADCAV